MQKSCPSDMYLHGALAHEHTGQIPWSRLLLRDYVFPVRVGEAHSSSTTTWSAYPPFVCTALVVFSTELYVKTQPPSQYCSSPSLQGWHLYHTSSLSQISSCSDQWLNTYFQYPHSWRSTHHSTHTRLQTNDNNCLVLRLSDSHKQ